MGRFAQKLKELEVLARKRLQPSGHLEGNNPWVDKIVFGLFDRINETGKMLSTAQFKAKVYEHLLDYLLEVMPSYDSATPLLGSKEEEAIFIAYKKRRFLEAAEPGDVILVRGNQRISRIIQTLTTSPYSHSAFYKGNGQLIEAEPEGVIVVPIDKYINLDIRICRPAMLGEEGKKKVCQHMEQMIKLQPRYDITNIEKLMFKYLYTKFRPDTKVYIGGSTDFERLYICSGLIAHGFQLAGYPISPSLRLHRGSMKGKLKLDSLEDFIALASHRQKNYSQIVPADFDNSPFFATVKFMYLDTQIKAMTAHFRMEREDPAQLAPLGEPASSGEVFIPWQEKENPETD